MTFKAKRKGNKFENDIGKLLSKWMFNDERVLTRHRTSGAQKHTYVGDLEPQRQLADYGWKKLPLLFELKNGYKQFEPTFNNQTKLKEWIIKACFELTEEQSIMWLIVRFKGRRDILLISSKELSSIHWDLALAVEHSGITAIFYIYKLKQIMKYDFKTIVECWPEFNFLFERQNSNT